MMLKYGTKVKMVKVKPNNQHLMDEVSEIVGYDLETDRYLVRDTKDKYSRWYMSADCFEVVDLDIEKRRKEIEQELTKLKAELDKMPKKYSSIVWAILDKPSPSALNLATRLGIECWEDNEFDRAVLCRISIEEIE